MGNWKYKKYDGHKFKHVYSHKNFIDLKTQNRIFKVFEQL